MTQQHPITPPEELVASMIEQAFGPLGATGLSNPDQLTGAFADLVTRAAQYGAGLLTTEKDWVRLPATWQGRIAAWPVRAVFEDEAALEALLKTTLDAALEAGTPAPPPLKRPRSSRNRSA